MNTGICVMTRDALYKSRSWERLAMDFRSTCWLAVLLASLVVTGPAAAEDPQPATGEKCVEQCDAESDKCMSDSENEPDLEKYKMKVQACDDRYSKCLQTCG
jgi:hypothetical protein